MAKKLTEDAVRDKARDILGFKDKDGVRSGVGQITTFNQLGFPGVSDKPDWSYMEQYMRNMMNVSEKVIENLGMLGL